MAEVEDAEVDVDSEAEEVVAASEVPGMIVVEAEMVAAAAGRGPATPGLVTGSAKFLTVETQTLAGGTNAISARNLSQQEPAILQVRSLM